MPNAAVSRLVLAKYSEQTVAETSREALHEIGGHVSCAIVFCTADYREQLPDFLETLQIHAHIPLLVGSSGTGLIGTSAEAENAHGFSLLLLHLPETKLSCFAFNESDAPDWETPSAWREAVGECESDAWMLIADPHTVPIETWLSTWSSAFPDTPCFGGLSSGGEDGGDTFVFHNRTMLQGGGVALGLRGGVKIRTLVSQGCRPIGEALPVTAVERNVIQSIGSRSAFKVLDEAFQSLSDMEKRAARGSLFAGLAMREDCEEFHRGDFLIRNILGVNQESGVVAIGALPRVGQTLQWQIRDAHAADEEMRSLASRLSSEAGRPIASLVFSCGGRGRSMFNTANHDAHVLAEFFGPHASAGYFCNGEIGPVGGKNFVHGFTASVALIE